METTTLIYFLFLIIITILNVFLIIKIKKISFDIFVLKLKIKNLIKKEGDKND